MLVVPASVNDSVITSAARLRYGSRFPLIKYFHPPKSVGFIFLLIFFSGFQISLLPLQTILATASRKIFSSSSSFTHRSSQSSLISNTSAISSSIQSSASIPEMQANGQLLDAMLSPSGRGLAINLANEASGHLAMSSSNAKSTKKGESFVLVKLCICGN